DQANAGSSKSSVSTGAIVGIAIGGVCFLAVVAAATVLILKCLNNNASREARPAVIAGGNNEKQMPMGDPVRVTSYYTGTDMGDKIPNTPPPPMMPYQNHPMMAPQANGSQPMSPHSMYSSGAAVPGARPDTMFSDAPTMSTRNNASYQANMRQGSEFSGSQGSGQPMMQGPYQVSNPNPNDMAPQRAGIASPPPPFSSHPQPQP
ncbi:hypothetical protein FRC00_012972, partial [Tulasnella sp. 408]